jgi:hypothetical protein
MENKVDTESKVTIEPAVFYSNAIEGAQNAQEVQVE